MITEMRLLSTGDCLVPEHIVFAGGTRHIVRLPSVAAYLHHDTYGHLLFDTSYSAHVEAQLGTVWGAIYGKAAPFEVHPARSLVAQLAEFGVRAADIRLVFLSHFHADHIGSVRDFPNARFVAHRKAWVDVAGKTGFAALRKGFLPELLPVGFAERLDLFDLPNGGAVLDYFGDGSVQLEAFEGHARGQIGATVRVGERRVLLAADASWARANHAELRLPRQVVRLFFDDWAAFKRSLAELHRRHLEDPDLIIVPSHCPAALAEFPKVLRHG